MKGISICIASGKGGVGKSTICANLGAVLSQLGVRTIVVDADVEGASIGLIYGMDSEADVPTLQDTLSGKLKPQDAVFELQDANGVRLLLGSIRVESLKDIQFDLFKGVISDLAERYEIVLIDSPAGLGVDSLTAISSCDAMLLVVTPDLLSVTSALKTKVVANRLGCKILGIVLNRVGGKYDIPTRYIEDLTGLKIISEIKEDEEVKKALSEGKLLLFQSPNSPASVAIKKLAATLVG